MKISIALASYNGSKYFLEQLHSFISQDSHPDELVIVDDGSSDNTVNVAAAFSKGTSFPVRIMQNEKNLGYAQNFAKALANCTGDLIFLSDQDDVWFEDKISTIHSLAESSTALVFMNDAELTDGQLAPSGFTKLGQLKDAGLGESSFVMGCCIAIRKELLDLLLPIPEICKSHDNWLVEFSDLLEVKQVVPTVLQYYRQHGNNNSPFFVNSTQKVSKLKVLSNRLKSMFQSLRGEDSLPYKLAVKREMKQRLLERSQAFYALLGKQRIDALVDSLSENISLNDARLKARQLPRHKRTVKIWNLRKQGLYTHSSGLLSMLKDWVV